jgi:hypothetical protein
MVDSRIVLDSLPDPTWRRSRDRVVEGADLTPTAAMTSSGRFTVRDSTSPCRAGRDDEIDDPKIRGTP